MPILPCWLLVAAPAPSAAPEPPPPVTPNVLVVVIDDLGIDMLAAYATGSFEEACITRPPTPNIERLMSRGVTFTNAWASPVCSPTRAMLMTGRYPFRTGIGTIVDPPITPDCDPSSTLRASEYTLPEMLAEEHARGELPHYRTAAIGKWHLGALMPDQHGFEQFWISPNNLGKRPGETYCRWLKNSNGNEAPSHVYATTDNVQDALAFIQQPGDERWFVYLAFNAGHAPYHRPPAALAPSYFGTTPGQCIHEQLVDAPQCSGLPTAPIPGSQPPQVIELCPDVECPPAECAEACELDLEAYPLQGVLARRPYYEAMIQAVDTELGNLMAVVEADFPDTLVVLLGDNGTPGSVTWEPFLGVPPLALPAKAKGTLHQGGINVPFVVAGAGVVNPGRASEALVGVTDVFATLADLLAIDLRQHPGAQGLDSHSFRHVLEDRPGVERALLFTETFSPNFPGPGAHPCGNGCADGLVLGRALRNERYKIIRWEPAPAQQPCGGSTLQFFDLETDPYEKNDLRPMVLGLPSSDPRRVGYDVLLANLDRIPPPLFR